MDTLFSPGRSREGDDQLPVTALHPVMKPEAAVVGLHKPARATFGLGL